MQVILHQLKAKQLYTDEFQNLSKLNGFPALFKADLILRDITCSFQILFKSVQILLFTLLIPEPYYSETGKTHEP